MDNDKILKAINKSGYKLIYIASVLNIHRTTLYRKLKGQTNWSEIELKILYELLGIKEGLK